MILFTAYVHLCKCCSKLFSEKCLAILFLQQNTQSKNIVLYVCSLLNLKKKTKTNYKRHEVTDALDCILSQIFLYTIILCLLFERFNAMLIAGICYVFRYTITMEGQMIMRNAGQSCNSVTF